MRLSHSFILVCAALCGAGLIPQRGIAQEAAFTLDRPVPSAGPTVAPPDEALSLAGPADQPIYACACGCGVFGVGTASMLPHGQGGMVWFEWDYQDQNQNRKGTSKAPAADNDDKDIQTSFYTAGFQYFFDRKWGLQVEVPVDHRRFKSEDGTFDWTGLGDVRVKGIYTGFFEDMSLGIDFGVKLATGDWTQSGPDRDTQIGTGSTDLLLGGFYRTNLSDDNLWTFFAQTEWDMPVFTQDDYRPGWELNSAAGIYYSGFSLHGVTISPVGQVILSCRGSDGGDNSAHPVASGYERVLLSPGIEFDFHPFTLYGDVEIPVYEYFRGDQLAAPALFKVILSYSF